MGEVQVTQTWLNSQWKIQVPPAWLDACINWIKDEAENESVPQSQLNQRVLEQWLLTDLRDLAHPVLPERISKAQKTELNRCCCVQIDSLLDVSQPAYTQLQRIRGKDCSNDQVSDFTQETQRPWEAKPTRMLMLQLTDGVQSLEGMEYRPIPALNANLPPGTKIQLIGPIVVRLGVLLLKAENVKVLGGEVEQLMEIYSQSRVLCETLGLPEENHPQVEEPDDQELPANGNAADHPVSDSGYDSLTSESSLRITHQSQHRPHVTPNSREDDWEMDEIPDDDLRSIPDDFDAVPQNAANDIAYNIQDDFDDVPQNATDDIVYDIPEDFDDIPLEELDSVMSPVDSEVLRSVSEIGIRDSNRPRNDDFSLQSSSSNTYQSRVNEVTRPSNASCSSNDVASFGLDQDSLAPMYLCTLQAGRWPPTSVQILRLQAFIVTLVGNLRSSGGVWKLGATISDGTGYLDVDLSNALLSGLIGFSAAEARVLRKEPAKRAAVDAGILHCQRELVDMCCMMSVEVDQTGRGVVLCASPLSDAECSEMQKRVKRRRN